MRIKACLRRATGTAAGGAAFAGAITFALLALTTSGSIARVWSVGIACGLGGLTGGYLGARLQPPIPDRGLTLLFGILAIALSITYIIEASIG